MLSWVGNNAYVSQIFTTSNSLFVKSYLNINNVNDPLNGQVQIGLNTALSATNITISNNATVSNNLTVSNNATVSGDLILNGAVNGSNFFNQIFFVLGN